MKLTPRLLNLDFCSMLIMNSDQTNGQTGLLNLDSLEKGLGLDSDLAKDGLFAYLTLRWSEQFITNINL